jgi:hypothetical protein
MQFYDKISIRKENFRETEEGAIIWKKTMNTIKAYTEPVLGII